jgi:hypothetical protein
VSAVDLDRVERTMAALFSTGGRAIQYHDRTTGEVLSVTPEAAASPQGLLPAFLVAGEAVWRDVTGKGFDLEIARDREALLGYRLRGIGAANFATVMLATMEATEQVARPNAIVVNELNTIWLAATIRQAAEPAPSGTGPGLSP